jgi:hypothetical protein
MLFCIWHYKQMLPVWVKFGHSKVLRTGRRIGNEGPRRLSVVLYVVLDRASTVAK